MRNSARRCGLGRNRLKAKPFSSISTKDWAIRSSSFDMCRWWRRAGRGSFWSSKVRLFPCCRNSPAFRNVLLYPTNLCPPLICTARLAPCRWSSVRASTPFRQRFPICRRLRRAAFEPGAIACDHDRLKVGLVRSGSPTHPNDHNRSLPLRTLSRILDVDATFISLQKDRRPDDKAELGKTGIIDWTAEFNDFADTAALVKCLDLVITVDTSIAHLAGALGCPT